VWSRGSREADVLEGLAHGRCYATSGERFYVEFRAGDRTLGETLVVSPTERVRVRARVAAAREVAWVEIVALDRALLRRESRAPEVELEEEVGPFPEGTSLWMRGASSDGERFWTTPVRVTAP
jgi:hypothetical protein